MINHATPGPVYSPRSGQTALHKAAGAKHRGICYMLVAAGGNLSLRDADGQTPMMHAFQANDHDLAAYLESEFLFCIFKNVNISTLKVNTYRIRRFKLA